MSILEIVVIGFMVNIFIVVIILFITLIHTLTKNKFDFKHQMELMELQKLVITINRLKKECEAKNIWRFSQADFFVFLPFVKLITLFQVITHILAGTLNLYYINKIQIGLDNLEQRIKEHDENNTKLP